MTRAELRQARKLLDLTQQQLADKLGVTRVSVGLWERGKKPIDRRTELSMARLLSLSGIETAMETDDHSPRE